MAEREGFEPPVELPPRLISSQVHSATLPPLRGAGRTFARIASVTNVLAFRHLSPVIGRTLASAYTTKYFAFG